MALTEESLQKPISLANLQRYDTKIKEYISSTTPGGSGSTVESSTTNGNIKIDGVETTVYTHPDKHLATEITEDATHRFVTDTEKTNWSAKETTTGSQAKADAALASAKSYTDTKVSSLVNSSPEALDTLSELAQALGNDANFSTTVTNLIGEKVAKTSISNDITSVSETTVASSNAVKLAVDAAKSYTDTKIAEFAVDFATEAEIDELFTTT